MCPPLITAPTLSVVCPPHLVSHRPHLVCAPPLPSDLVSRPSHLTSHRPHLVCAPPLPSPAPPPPRTREERLCTTCAVHAPSENEQISQSGLEPPSTAHPHSASGPAVCTGPAESARRPNSRGRPACYSKKRQPPRTLQYDYAYGPTAVLRGWLFLMSEVCLCWACRECSSRATPDA